MNNYIITTKENWNKYFDSGDEQDLKPYTIQDAGEGKELVMLTEGKEYFFKLNEYGFTKTLITKQ